MTQPPTAQLSAREVADFLRQHPRFFNEYPDLIGAIQWVSPSTEQTISFAERQIIHLRDKLAGLEKKLLELIEFGSENDELLLKYHTMAVRLIRAHSLSSVFDVVYSTIREDFNLPYVAIRLWPPDRTLLVGPEFETIADGARSYVENLSVPFVGPILALPHYEDFSAWFWTPLEQVGSVALLALRDGDRPVGALLIGSSDSSKFTRQMGTLYLEQMTDQITAAICRAKN